MENSWKDWVIAFTRAYRTEAEELSEQEKIFFGEFIDEQCLSKPCQIELFEFADPYCLVWLLILDESKQDLKVTFRKATWKNVSMVAEQLAEKYGVSFDDILRMLDGFRGNVRSEQMNFAIDMFEHVLGLSFPDDVRVWKPSLLKSRSPSPENIADMVFRINYCQARDRYAKYTIDQVMK